MKDPTSDLCPVRKLSRWTLTAVCFKSCCPEIRGCREGSLTLPSHFDTPGIYLCYLLGWLSSAAPVLGAGRALATALLLYITDTSCSLLREQQEEVECHSISRNGMLLILRVSHIESIRFRANTADMLLTMLRIPVPLFRASLASQTRSARPWKTMRAP